MYAIIYSPDRRKDKEIVVLDILFKYPTNGMSNEQWTFYDKLAGEPCRLLDEDSDWNKYTILTREVYNS